MKRVTRAIILAIVTLLLGCTSYHDKNIANYEIKTSLLPENAGQPRVSYFKNNATYRTKIHECPTDGKYACVDMRGGAGKLSPIFVGNKSTPGKIELIRISAPSKSEFILDFINDESNVVYSRHFADKNDFELGRQGEIRIRTWGRCGGPESLGVGCESTYATLFEDKDRNLVVIQSYSGAGLAFFVVPVGGKVESVSVFPRVENVPSDMSP